MEESWSVLVYVKVVPLISHLCMSFFCQKFDTVFWAVNYVQCYAAKTSVFASVMPGTPATVSSTCMLKIMTAA